MESKETILAGLQHQLAEGYIANAEMNRSLCQQFEKVDGFASPLPDDCDPEIDERP